MYCKFCHTIHGLYCLLEGIEIIVLVEISLSFGIINTSRILAHFLKYNTSPRGAIYRLSPLIVALSSSNPCGKEPCKGLMKNVSGSAKLFTKHFSLRKKHQLRSPVSSKCSTAPCTFDLNVLPHQGFLL